MTIDISGVRRRIVAINKNFKQLLAYRQTLNPPRAPFDRLLATVFYEEAVSLGFSATEAKVISGWVSSFSRAADGQEEIMASVMSAARQPAIISRAHRLMSDPATNYIDIITEHLSEARPYNDADAGYISTMTVAISGGSIHPDTWQGIDLSGIEPVSRLRVWVMLYAPGTPVTQEEINFLVNGRPVSDLLDYDIATMGHKDDFNAFNFVIDTDLRDLARGFVHRLLDEARPYRDNVPVGVYRMRPPDFPALDTSLTVPYTEIKFFVSPAGLRGVLEMMDGGVAPFFWSPEYTTIYEYGDRIGWLLNVVFAGVWRDVSVIRRRWRTVRRTDTPKSPSPRKQRRRKNRLKVMPRTVYHIEWGSETDRQTIRTRHAVRGFYRRLPVGQKTSPTAIDNARREGHPPPPDGWTYVRAHQRGGHIDDDKIVAADSESGLPEIVCRGLQTVSLLMQLGE